MKKREFYDLGIRCQDERAESFASELGFKEIWRLQTPENFEGGTLLLSTSDQREFRKQIARFHEKAKIIGVLSSTLKDDRRYIRNDFIHFLHGAHRYRFNRSFVRELKDNNVAVIFDLSPLLERGRVRSISLYRMRHNFRLVKKREILFLISSGAKTLLSMRAPMELVAMATLFEMDREDALRALSDNAEKLRRRTSPHYIREGVEVVEKNEG